MPARRLFIPPSTLNPNAPSAPRCPMHTRAFATRGTRHAGTTNVSFRNKSVSIGTGSSQHNPRGDLHGGCITGNRTGTQSRILTFLKPGSPKCESISCQARWACRPHMCAQPRALIGWAKPAMDPQSNRGAAFRNPRFALFSFFLS